MTYESTFQLGTMDVKSWDEELNLGLKCKASPRYQLFYGYDKRQDRVASLNTNYAVDLTVESTVRNFSLVALLVCSAVAEPEPESGFLRSCSLEKATTTC